MATTRRRPSRLPPLAAMPLFGPLSIASVVFLLPYTALTGTLICLMATSRVPWNSRWLVLLVHTGCAPPPPTFEPDC
jgi:hypothetical protein